jgi:RHS repeat-associated protein
LYPFGLKHKGYNSVINPNGNSTAQKFGFGGKELSEELGLNTLDFGARNYDPAIGRWMNLDPMADRNYTRTPYRYGYNNPIKFVDPDGKYERDGHYWTVYLAGILSGSQAPGSIAYYAEEPDHIMSISGDILMATNTWLLPSWQTNIHALTGSDAVRERAISRTKYSNSKTNRSKGWSLHRLGDSYAHSKANGKMYKKGFGHAFDGHTPDKIANRPELYLEYVKDLVSTLGGSNVDMFAFDYIANSGGTTEQNSAVLETEVRIQEGVSMFSVKGDQTKTVGSYLGARNKKHKKQYKTTKAEVDVYKRNEGGEWVKGGTETRTFITLNN